jgi:hypothetical protein
MTSSGLWYAPPKLPSPMRARTAAGGEARISSRSRPGFGSRGAATLPSLVQAKFSIQLAWEPDGSIPCTFAQVQGAFHQL